MSDVSKISVFYYGDRVCIYHIFNYSCVCPSVTEGQQKHGLDLETQDAIL